MKVLLDTHIALWAAQGASQLSARAAQLIEDPASTLLVSAAAIWEIAIKFAKGNLPVHPRDARTAFRLAGFAELPVDGSHTEAVASLPAYPDHADPFDRLMVAQALQEGVPLLTADPKLWRYHPTLILRA
ncbi:MULTISPECIES: type II toxin-antitoxin system VapC family toxin [Paraburkholderia]|uniref:Type II toxin-antitoxin system VapC family toxin n=1 Tax=Paraburkholderia acidicola TaxID=1912599 RepID=A0ABV1LYK7_9BURK